jgi:hypothetical protein
LGLLVQQLLGDEYLAAHGAEIASLLAALLFDGLRPDPDLTRGGTAKQESDEGTR